MWQRQSGLEGLVDLVASYPPSTMAVHLSSFLEAASRLTLDSEVDVRKLAVRLLLSILTAVDDGQLAPSFEIVTRYLACSMSHINSAVRETSLDVLDVLITKSPKLTATHCQVIYWMNHFISFLLCLVLFILVGRVAGLFGFNIIETQRFWFTETYCSNQRTHFYKCLAIESIKQFTFIVECYCRKQYIWIKK